MMLDFVEQLPEQCPPSDASDAEWHSIYRLVANESPDHTAFKSYAALGKVAPEGFDLCRWASCSLLLNVAAKNKLPQLKGHHWVAKVTIPSGAGMSKRKKNHVDFWCRKDFDLESAVVEVTRL